MGTRADDVGKRVAFDPETFDALQLVARDRIAMLQELADEAFRDLLGEASPARVQDMLTTSANESAAGASATASGRSRKPR